MLLVAAGFAPAFPQRSLDDPALASVRAAVDQVLAEDRPGGLEKAFCCINATARDFDATLRFKPVSGTREQAGGLMFRAWDATDYFVARASALDGTVKLYRMIGGRRAQLATKDAKVTLGQWHELRVLAADKRIEVYFDGTAMFALEDRGIIRPGAIGVWSPADSVTHFGSLLVGSPSPPAR